MGHRRREPPEKAAAAKIGCPTGGIILCTALCLSACGLKRDEAAIRKQLQSGSVALPSGVIEIHSELALPDGAHDVEIAGNGSILQAASDFRGRALFRSKSGARIRFRDFTIDGNRDAIEYRAGLPDFNTPFHRFTPNNGILIEGGDNVSISRVTFRRVSGFSILVSRSKRVRIERVVVEDSGSRNPSGRNNATGGILLEEGATNFQVLDCKLKNIRGNGVWTHSLYSSPRNANGIISGNEFELIGRDAIQVGHATQIKVERNSGQRIGYPESEVDLENRAIPVAIDTAGNVDLSSYSFNRFSEINGKCIDLDGFHNGEVSHNWCVNQANFGIVMNNTNPDMQSEAITIAENVIEGARYGGIFVIGAGNQVVRNRLHNLNTSHSTKPDLLRSGIYLGRGAERPAIARGNLVKDNVISGFRLRCVAADKGVSLADNKIGSNDCAESTVDANGRR